MCPQGFNSYLEMSEEGTQVGTESTSWGVDSGLFRTGLYIESESMAPANEQSFLTEIGRSGTQDRAVKRHRMLGKKCEGSITFPVYPEGGGDKGGIGLILKHLFGDISSGTYSGAGTALHEFIPHDNLVGNLAASSSGGAGTGRAYGITVNVGREDTAGTIANYPFMGCRIRSVELTCAAGEELKCTTDMVGRVAKASGAAKSVSFPTMEPFMWKDATFQIGVDEAGAGGTEQTIDAFTLSIANNLTELWTLGTNVLGRVVPNGQRVVTGSFTAPYEGWVKTEFEKWDAGTPSSFNISFVNGPYRFEIRCAKIYYTGNAPSIDSMEENVVELPFQCVVNSAFDVKAMLVNTDSQVGFSIV